MSTLERTKPSEISIAPSGRMEPMSAGLCLGALLGAWHLAWSLLVALGWAQPLADFIFKLHFIQPVYVIRPFEVGTAALLVLITTVTGFVFGYLFGLIWNQLGKASR